MSIALDPSKVNSEIIDKISKAKSAMQEAYNYSGELCNSLPSSFSYKNYTKQLKINIDNLKVEIDNTKTKINTKFESALNIELNHSSKINSLLTNFSSMKEMNGIENNNFSDANIISSDKKTPSESLGAKIASKCSSIFGRLKNQVVDVSQKVGTFCCKAKSAIGSALKKVYNWVKNADNWKNLGAKISKGAKSAWSYVTNIDNYIKLGTKIANYTMDWIEDPVGTFIKTGASILNLGASFLKGLISLVEAIGDFALILVALSDSVQPAIIDEIYYLWSGKSLGLTETMWKKIVVPMVSFNWVNWLDEKIGIRQKLDNFAYDAFKTDGIACQISEGVGYVTGIIVISALTFGAGGAAAGGVSTGATALTAGAAGMGKGTEEAWSQQSDQKVLIMATEELNKEIEQGIVTQEMFDEKVKELLKANPEIQLTEEDVSVAIYNDLLAKKVEEINKRPGARELSNNEIIGGLGYGTMTGVIDGIQWYAGQKINGLFKGSGTKITNKAVASLLRMGADTVDAVAEIPFRTYAQTLYRTDEQGNKMSFSEVFEANGGWDQVKIQAGIAGAASGLGEAVDVTSSARTVKKMTSFLDGNIKPRTEITDKIIDKVNKSISKMKDIDAKNYLESLDGVERVKAFDQMKINQQMAKSLNSLDDISLKKFYDSLDKGKQSQILGMVNESKKSFLVAQSGDKVARSLSADQMAMKSQKDSFNNNMENIRSNDSLSEIEKVTQMRKIWEEDLKTLFGEENVKADDVGNVVHKSKKTEIGSDWKNRENEKLNIEKLYNNRDSLTENELHILEKTEEWQNLLTNEKNKIKEINNPNVENNFKINGEEINKNITSKTIEIKVPNRETIRQKTKLKINNKTFSNYSEYKKSINISELFDDSISSKTINLGNLEIADLSIDDAKYILGSLGLKKEMLANENFDIYDYASLYECIAKRVIETNSGESLDVVKILDNFRDLNLSDPTISELEKMVSINKSLENVLNLVNLDKNTNISILTSLENANINKSSINKIDYDLSFEDLSTIRKIIDKTNRFKNMEKFTEFSLEDKLILDKFLKSGAGNTILLLSDEAYNSLFTYSSMSWTDINKYLDDNIDRTFHGYNLKCSDMVEEIDSVMNVSKTDSTIILNRGTTIKEFEGVKNLSDIEGKILDQNRYKSTCKGIKENIGTSKGGMATGADADSLQVKIDYVCPKGTKCVNLAAMVDSDIGDEVLLARKQRIRYDSVIYDGDTACVLAVILPDGIPDNISVKDLVDEDTYKTIISKYNVNQNSSIKEISKSTELFDAKKLPFSSDPKLNAIQQKMVKNEELTMFEKINLRDHVETKIENYDLKSDHAYRVVDEDTWNVYLRDKKIYSKSDDYILNADGTSNGNGGCDWYLGGYASKYGGKGKATYVIETPANKNLFQLARDNGNGMSDNVNVRHIKSFNTHDQVSIDNVSKVFRIDTDGTITEINLKNILKTEVEMPKLTSEINSSTISSSVDNVSYTNGLKMAGDLTDSASPKAIRNLDLNRIKEFNSAELAFSLKNGDSDVIKRVFKESELSELKKSLSSLNHTEINKVMENIDLVDYHKLYRVLSESDIVKSLDSLSDKSLNKVINMLRAEKNGLELLSMNKEFVDVIALKADVDSLRVIFSTNAETLKYKLSKQLDDATLLSLVGYGDGYFENLLKKHTLSEWITNKDDAAKFIPVFLRDGVINPENFAEIDSIIKKYNLERNFSRWDRGLYLMAEQSAFENASDINVSKNIMMNKSPDDLMALLSTEQGRNVFKKILYTVDDVEFNKYLSRFDDFSRLDFDGMDEVISLMKRMDSDNIDALLSSCGDADISEIINKLDSTQLKRLLNMSFQYTNTSTALTKSKLLEKAISLNLFSNSDFNMFVSQIIKNGDLNYKNFKTIQKYSSSTGFFKKYHLNLGDYDSRVLDATTFAYDKMIKNFKKRFGKYLPEGRLESVYDSFIFKSQEEFIKLGYGNAMAYNDPSGKSIMNVDIHPLANFDNKTRQKVLKANVNHESVHQVSRIKGSSVTGVFGLEVYRGINECFTELLNKKSLGKDYPKVAYCAYQSSMKELERLLKYGKIKDKEIFSIYFNNNIDQLDDLFKKRFNLDENQYQKLVNAFNNAHHGKTDAVNELSKMITSIILR